MKRDVCSSEAPYAAMFHMLTSNSVYGDTVTDGHRIPQRDHDPDIPNT